MTSEGGGQKESLEPPRCGHHRLGRRTFREAGYMSGVGGWGWEVSSLPDMPKIDVINGHLSGPIVGQLTRLQAHYIY